MRNTRAIVVLVLAAMLVPGTVLLAEQGEEITGRVVVEKGTVATLSGTLVPEAEEWQLRVGEKLYDLHLGQFGHDGKNTAALKAGAQATVNGFVYGEHISPISLESGGATLRFREADGRPLWSGMRLGPNAQDRPEQGLQGARDGSGARGGARDGASGTGWGRNRLQG